MAVVTLAFAPIVALIKPTPPLPADELKERIALWVKGTANKAAPAASADAGAAAGGGGGGGGSAPASGDAAASGLSPEDLQTFYTKVNGLLKAGSETSKGAAIYFECDTVTRF